MWSSIAGESNSVDEDIVIDWKAKLAELVKDYAPKDVFNGDETGLFYRMLPTKTFAVKGEACKGGKMSKERLTVFVCAHMTGHLETPW